MLEALDLFQRGVTEVVLVGDSAAAEFRSWVERLGLLYVPNLSIFIADPSGAAANGTLPEQVRGKRALDGRVTAYVCRQRTCTAPITEFRDLAKELGA